MIYVAHRWDGHPLPAPVASLRVEPGRTWRIEVSAVFFGDPAPTAAPGPTDRLWEHEVVELFVADDDERYVEIELGPHGHHLVLQLDGVRRPVRSAIPITWEARVVGDRWRGVALVDGALFPAPSRFNAYAIHGTGADRQYLAASPVPGPAPDFHRLHAFAPWPPEPRPAG